jgi:uncharacterized membrane protein YecN with MAPEG domain
MLLPVTLTSAAAAALITMWLGMRVGRVRAAEKVSHGDGGVPLLTRRMRAQLNFVEYTPFVLILMAAIEIAGKGGQWLAIVSAVYMFARVAHGMGMDAESGSKGRMVGIMVTMLTLIGLALYAALVAAKVV